MRNLRVSDVVDILFLTLVVYYLYTWFRGTKAFKAMIGLMALGLIYTIARSWGLFLTTWVFQILWQVLVILLIILFQSEIRQVLERVNPLQVIGFRSPSGEEGWIGGLVEAIFSMSRRRIGALIIIERSDRVEEWTTACVSISAEPSPEILLSLFQKESRLHDGSALIRRGYLVSTACYLPLSSAEGLPKEWGTRHRAGLGLSERCDAWVVVVSEERGEVSLAKGGTMTRIKTAGELSDLLRKAVLPPHKRSMEWGKRMKSMIFNRWKVKMGLLALVTVVWLVLAGDQNFQVTVNTTVQMSNLPAHLEILGPSHPEVQITIEGLRKEAAVLSRENVQAVLDLSGARVGTETFSIEPSDISLPNDQLGIISIRPSRLEFTFRERT